MNAEIQDSSWVIEIVDKERGHTRRIELPPGPGSFSSAIIRDGQVVALGTLLGSAGEIAIVVSLDDAKIVSQIWCGHPRLSPDSQFVVFEDFIPRFTAPPSDHGISVLGGTGAEAPTRQVYPILDELQLQTSDSTDWSGPIHWPVSPISWSKDSRMLSFIDRYSTWGDWRVQSTTSWVVVDLSQWPDSAKYLIVPLDPVKYANPGTPVGEVKFSVESLEWIDDFTVVAKLREPEHWAISEITFKVPPSFPSSATGRRLRILQ